MAAVVASDSRTDAVDAAGLLLGYSGRADGRWAEGPLSLAWAGSTTAAFDGDLVVLVEGRLDNSAELATKAGIREAVDPAQLIAACWRKAGPKMLDWVVGDLAGIVVERAGARVHAFRDICGARPLHVTRYRGGWAVASDSRRLAELAGTARRPSAEWFSAAFTGHSFEARVTPYANVEMVVPGHVAVPGSSAWTQTRHADWHVPWLRDKRPGAYDDEFRDLLGQAVSCRIGGHGRAGVSLSGGLDSTSVMATAAAVRPDIERVALCLGLQEPAGDERPLQSLVAERAGAELRWVDTRGRGAFGLDGPEALLDEMGAPPLVINWFLGDAVAEEAHAAGLQVVLDGEDGDGSVGGNFAYVADLLATGRWVRWHREFQMMRRGFGFGGKHLLRENAYLLAPPALRRAYLRRVEMSPDVLAKPLVERIDLERRLGHQYLNRAWRPGRFFRYAQAEVGKAEQMGPILTSIGDPWRRRGVALSHPWSDRRLMSFCMGLPYEHVIRSEGVRKVILRSAMMDRLPPEVTHRRGKADISEVAQRQARGPAHDHLKEGLRLAREQNEWFDPGEVTALEARFDAGKAEAPALRVAMFAWWLHWCDGAGSRTEPAMAGSGRA